MLVTLHLPLVLLLLIAAGAACGDDFFDDSIAPMIARRCLDCHNEVDVEGGLDLSARAAAERGGESGRAIAPGKTAASLLWEKVASGDMPPENPLPKEERELLRRWIASGAKWSQQRIDRFAYSSDVRAGYDWWSLQPLRRPQVPRGERGAPTENAIDAFVQRRLAAAKLTMSPQAERAALVRRLSFDLLGLPPAPVQVAAFLADDSPDAYRRLVDRLLASPDYGQRWARHWLDIVRFGESQGFERDKLRENSWPYRDWVVEAFNRDLPYDRFARLQLAGDVTDGSVVPTGMLVAGPYDEVGQNQQSAAMKAVVRQDELEDLVSVVGQTFLGLTIHCARCHDHKFDPIRQKEYYRLTAALAGVRHGDRAVPIDERRAGILRVRIAAVAAKLAALESPARAAILAERKREGKPGPPPPLPFAAWEFDGNLEDAMGRMHGKANGNATVENGRLILKEGGYVLTSPLPKGVTEKTLTARVKLASLDSRGGGAISLQSPSGATFDAIVFGEREPQRWMAGSNFFKRTQNVGGDEEREAAEGFVHIAIRYAADGTIALFRNGRPYGKPYRSGGPVSFSAGKAQISIGLRHLPPGGNKGLSAEIDAARLYDRALTADEIAAAAGGAGDFVSQREIVARLSENDRQRREALRRESAAAASELASMRSGKVYAVTPRPPGETHLLVRGSAANRGELVAPGGVASLAGVSAEFDLGPRSPDAQRRRKLADWIATAENPLFARVLANRLWHYHFGAGLVPTPSDFGFNGGRPSHPDLLDYLAAELIDSGWSIKHVQRLIVTSAAYRQSSRHRRDASATDAGNRLLWRKSPRRLDAEEVRDAILQTAGVLNRQIGGPGYRDFRTFTRNTQFYEEIDPAGAKFNRRTLYRTWVRSSRNRLLSALDCPDPSTKTPRRATTVTPLQSLSLLNNSFVLRMADRFAERIERESGADASRQIDAVWRLAFGRPPAEEERRLAARFVAAESLPALCRVILNSNEFLHVD